jgi:hypothetical protein
MSADAWTHGHAAWRRAEEQGLTATTVAAIIDYTLPSSTPRLWIVDLSSGEVLRHELVAHGIGSGGTLPHAFSNRTGSYQSSLGAFITQNSYRGIRGLSLRLKGLEPGINDRALARGIVLHGTPNVSPARARAGTLGRTEACPAVSSQSAREVIRLLGAGTLLFVWYPDKTFLARSEYLDRSVLPVYLGDEG